MATQNESDLTDFYKCILENNKTLFFLNTRKTLYHRQDRHENNRPNKGHYNILEPKKQPTITILAKQPVG